MNRDNLIKFYSELVTINKRIYKYKLSLFKETNDKNEIINILKKSLNIHMNFNMNFNIIKDKHKVILFMKKKELYFYPIYKLFGQYIGHIFVLNILNDKNELNDFPLSILNVSIKPKCSFKYLKLLNNYKIKNFYSMAYNKNLSDLPFIFYYIVNPKSANKEFKGDYQSTINNLIEKGNMNYSINKLLFRGTSNNKYRKYLFFYYKNRTQYVDFKDTDSNLKSRSTNYLSFEDYTKYKYILDINGIDGHRARTIYMFFLNRVLFLPIDDPNKLFYEKWKNPPKPNVHFVPYSLKKLNEFEEKVKYYENNPDKYNEIRENCAKYAKENLTIDNFYKYTSDLLNNKIK